MLRFYPNRTPLRDQSETERCTTVVFSRKAIYPKWQYNYSLSAVSRLDRLLRPRRRYVPVVQTSRNLCSFSWIPVHRWAANDRDWHWSEPRWRETCWNKFASKEISAYFTDVGINAPFLKATTNRMFFMINSRKITNRIRRFSTKVSIVMTGRSTKSPTPKSDPSYSIESVAIWKEKVRWAFIPIRLIRVSRSLFEQKLRIAR